MVVIGTGCTGSSKSNCNTITNLVEIMIPDVETDRKFLRIIRLLPRRRRHRNVAKKGGASVFSSSAVPAMVGHVKDQNPRSRIPWVE